MKRWASFLAGMAIAFAAVRLGQHDYATVAINLLIGIGMGLIAIGGDPA